MREKGATNIALDSLSYFLFETTSSPTAGQETADNIRIESLSITAFTDVAADTDGRGSIFTNISPIRNLVIEDVHFQGGSLYNNAAASPGLTKRYIGHIASVSAVGTYLGNYNITIKDSIFSVEGGGIFLDGCRNVKIHDCTFQSENSDFTFVGMSEGIVIDGNTPSGVNGARYGSNDPTLALGEVSISDCKFLGQQTNMSALPGDVPTRGWIFTTPDYLGSPIAVNNCQFVGDRFGLTAIAATRPTDHIDVQRGAAFHHASETVLKVVGCLAHSYEYGGFVAGGAVTIDTTDFIECGEDIMVGNDTASPGGYWNYAYLNAAWVLSSELNLSVTACNFYGKGSLTSPTSISTGISFFRNTDDSESKNVSVSGCKFESINRAFNGVDLNLYAHSIVNPSVQYDSLKIINNLFNDMETAVFYSTTSLTNAATVVSRSWVIEKLIYSNNVHDQCGHNITSQDRGLLEFTAQTVIVDSNTFTDCHLSGGTAADPNRIIHFDGGFKSGVITQ